MGTSACRAVVFDLNGRSVGQHYREVAILHPVPGAAEQRAEDWWEAACECIRGAVVDARCAAGDIAALGMSVQGHSWVATDADYRPLRPALTWLDTRAAGQATKLLGERGAAFWGAHAGKLPGTWHLLPQLLWLREAEPDIIAGTRHCLFAQAYLLQRLTGEDCCDYATAAGSLLVDIRDFAWDAGLLADYGISASSMSRLAGADAAAGRLTAKAAEATGLPPGLVVAVGSQDQKCAALGAGIGKGVATASLGTATAISALTPQPDFAPDAAIPCFPYLRRGTWVLEAPLVTSGAAYRWLRGVLREGAGGAEIPDYAAMDALAGQSPPGANGVTFLPFLAGAGAPHWRADARGVFAGLHLGTGAGDLARAILEGVAYEMRSNVEAMRALGAPLGALRVFGGGAKSALWVGIIADVLGMPVELCADVEAAAAGAAMLGAVAAGVFDDLETAQRALGGASHPCTPGEHAPAYQELYEAYCQQRAASLQ